MVQTFIFWFNVELLTYAVKRPVLIDQVENKYIWNVLKFESYFHREMMSFIIDKSKLVDTVVWSL